MSTESNTTRAGTETRKTLLEALDLCHYTTDSSPFPLLAAEDATHTVIYVNLALCLLTGKKKEELLGLPFAESVLEGKENGCLALFDRVYRTGTAENLVEQEHFTSEAKRVIWSYAVWAIFDANERPAGVMAQITDTTESALFRRQIITLNQALLISGVRLHELKEETEGLNVQLQALAATDGLTGLKNHRTFQERLREEVERAVRYATPLSLLFVDVDAFKAYNDAHWHPAGDAVLRKIGEILQATARMNDLIARYGGEEFAIILPETDAANAACAGERFRAAIAAAEWQERQVTVSVGAATLSSTVRDPAALIGQADTALYRSKERGRNCVTHSMDPASGTGRPILPIEP